MKLLIVGNDYNSHLFAEFVGIQNPDVDVFLTTELSDGNYTPINIIPDRVPELTDFAKYNNIDFTVVFSPVAIMNGIADEFYQNGLKIFAPVKETAGVMYFNSIEKKLMYKLKIPISKFGIFDRENMALEYLRNSKFPVKVKNDFTLFDNISIKCKNFKEAKYAVSDIFEKFDKKAVIENFVSTEPSYLYFITDGYNAMPLVNLKKSSGENYKIAKSPAGNISDNITRSILGNVIYPLLDDISKFAGVYKGILGLKLYIKQDNYLIGGIYGGFSDYDFSLFLSDVDENVLKLFIDASNGQLCENRDYIRNGDLCSVTVAVDNKMTVALPEEDSNLFSFMFSDKTVFTSRGLNMQSAVNNFTEETKTLFDEKFHEEISSVLNRERIRL